MAEPLELQDRRAAALAEALSADWDRLVQGELAPPLAAPEALLEPVRTVHALAATPILSPRQRAQIWEAILAGSGAGAASPTVLPPRDASRGVPSASRPARPGVGAEQHAGWFAGRWLATPLATAALLGLMLLVGVVVLRGARVGHEGAPVLGIPAALVPPATPASPLAASPILLEGTIDALPDLTYWIGIGRTVLDPGVAFTLGQGQVRGDGPVLLRVESGVLTLTATGPITVTRAGDARPQAIPAKSAVTLQAGDQSFSPMGVTTEWRNAGTAPVQILSAGLMTSGTLWQTEVAGRFYDELLGEYGMTPPTPPVTISVRRVTLTGEETLAVDAVPGLEMLRVETGHLVALDPAPPGTVAPYAFEKGTAAQANFRPGRVFRSADGAPATLLLMTITPAAAATPPPAA